MHNNMKRFEDQVAVITGGADGLGKGVALRIASEGGNVVLLDINQPLLQKTIEEFHSKNFLADGFLTDISAEADVKSAFSQIVSKYGKIDILIHAAGIVGLQTPGSPTIV
jgi:2-dehydro-3-deoxy-L-rhamnonate dehydrogenase (NAD+)